MAKQNLVSATLSAETKEDVLGKLAEIRSKLGFLLSLGKAELQSLIKAGNNYMPFVEQARAVIDEHPGIMSGLFDIEEFKNDYALSKDLSAIVTTINQLAETLTNTLIAVNSDVMNASLEVYAAVKQNRSRVPGLNVVAEGMGEFFKRPKRKSAQ